MQHFLVATGVNGFFFAQTLNHLRFVKFVGVALELSSHLDPEWQLPLCLTPPC